MKKRRNKRLDMRTRFLKASRRNMVYSRPGLHTCILVLDGLKPDFNIGKIFRSADAFGAREIHLIGIDFFDPDPAKGSVRWVPFVLHDNFAQCYDSLIQREYSFVTLEPNGQKRLANAILPQKVAFVLGHEEFGLSFDPQDYAAIRSFSIPQWGRVQSLNVSIAASLALYEYISQHGQLSECIQGETLPVPAGEKL